MHGRQDEAEPESFTSAAVLRRRGGREDSGDVAEAGDVDEGGEAAEELRPRLRRARELEQGLDDCRTHAEHEQRRGEVADGVLRPVAAEDRKSTRLNSSHVAISYAVFCMKKKKKI